MPPSRATAAILAESNKPLIVDEIEVPEPGVGQVLVHVMASGICGKQIDEITCRRGPDKYLPHLLGHEGSGLVIAKGPGVRKVDVGDFVVMHWMKGSGIDAAPAKYRWQGKPLNAGCITTFQTHALVSENRVTTVGLIEGKEDNEFECVALLGCAVTTGLGIVFNDAQLKPGQSITVFGAGGVGLNVIQGAKLVNAHVHVAEKDSNKWWLAEKMGANHCTGIGVPADVVVDTTGLCRAAAYVCAKELCILSGVPPVAVQLSIDTMDLNMGKRLIGSHGGGTVPDRDIPRYAGLWRAGKLNLADQIGERFKLQDINDAIDYMRSGKPGRCIIRMDQK